MRIFHCDRCGDDVAFSAHRCPTCEAPLGYVDHEGTIRVLVPATEPGSYTLAGDGSAGDGSAGDGVAGDGVAGGDRAVWRCLNAAWGCNWVVPAGSDNSWCRSCQLTRGRPDEARPAAVEAWMAAEAAKRRLVHQLDELALPIEARTTSVPDGLAFDLVYLPGTGGITGHLDGVVTLDLAETDDQHRDDLRRRLGEPFRTVIGHLRHEIGHHYWNRLVGQSNDLGRFRQLFGDERVDYADAIDDHYSTGGTDWDASRFVTAYAASHPLEDWAESFAHYLHIVDAVDTAVAHDLIPPGTTGVLVADVVGELEFDDLLGAWRPINNALNAMAETLGAPAVYPIQPRGRVVDKLAFVHQQIAAHTARDRFYADL